MALVWLSLSTQAILLRWILTRPMATLVYLLGDGHRNIWALFGQMTIASLKDKILDWFHLKENLYKVDAHPDQLETIASHLWEGQVDQAKAVLKDIQTPSTSDMSCFNVSLDTLNLLFFIIF